MLDLLPCLVVMLAFGGIGGFIIASEIANSRSKREQALEAQIEALKQVNHLGAAFFDAQAQLQAEMAAARATRQRRAPR